MGHHPHQNHTFHPPHHHLRPPHPPHHHHRHQPNFITAIILFLVSGRMFIKVSAQTMITAAPLRDNAIPHHHHHCGEKE